MKPGFALSLSYEGMSLLHRAAGGWRLVGDVALDSTDMAGDLAVLRDKALVLDPGGLRCKVILPNDQIRYLSVETGSLSGEARDAMVRSALDGATPYAVDDLAYDISEDGGLTHVAAVARETLAEAESFAVDYLFNPVSFVAIPGESAFLGEPFFGVTKHAASLPEGGVVDPDGIAVVVIGPAEEPTPDVPPEVESQRAPSEERAPLEETLPEPEPDPEPVPEADAAPKPVTAGFTSRRRVQKPSPAPSLGGAKREVPPPVVPVAGAERVDVVERPTEKTAEPPAAAESAMPDTDPPIRRPQPEPDPLPLAEPAFFADEPESEGLADLPPTYETEGAFEPEPEVEPEPEPEVEVEPEVDAISVTAPSLDIPEFADPEQPVTPEETGSAFGRFLSRRTKKDTAQPVAAPQTIQPVPVAVSRPISAPVIGNGKAVGANEDEAARMTVFGARETAKVGGKPRYLGLMLTFGLLLFLAVVAVWAAIFLDEGVAGLFGGGKDEPQLVAVPGTPTISSAGSVPAPAPTSVAPSAPAQPQAGDQTPATSTELAALPPTQVPPSDAPEAARSIEQGVLPTPDQPSAPSLTDTDSAVLDALRQPTPQQVPTDPEVDGDAVGTDTAGVDPAALGAAGSPEAVARYAATGIWQSAPQEPDTPSIIGLNDLYVASIDRTDMGHDAVALPPVAGFGTDLGPNAVSSPVAADTAFDLDARGLVVATAAGTLNPDGVMVFLGRPAVVPPAVPTRFETQPETDALRDRLAGLRPRARPNDLGEQFERTQLGGLTRDELGGLRPKARPRTIKQVAEQDETPTAAAVAASRQPKPRPRDFAAVVRKSTPDPDRGAASGGRDGQQVATIAPRTVKPSIPSSASVARQATLNNAINLQRVNLIGVYGTPSNRRALVRLPSGRYKKVKVGDTVDGGRVVAIGDSELRYQKGGRNLTLKIPSG